MTFPTYSPGDLGTSAWANLVGDFLDDRVICDQAFGSFPAATLTDLSWSTLQDPGGKLQSNGIEFLLPNGHTYMVALALYYQPLVSTGDYVRLYAVEQPTGTVRLRRDLEIAQTTTDIGHALVGRLNGKGTLYKFQVFSNVGGAIPAGDATNLAIWRIGG